MRDKSTTLGHPLPLHPEFCTLHTPGYYEYRLDRSVNLMKVAPAFLVATMVVFCPQLLRDMYGCLLILLCLALFPGLLLFQLLSESLVLLPPHGIQLEKQYGLPGVKPLISSRLFIPSVTLEGVFIHEGLRGWNILYYLVMVQKGGSEFGFHVVYKDLQPDRDILLKTYEAVQEVASTGANLRAD